MIKQIEKKEEKIERKHLVYYFVEIKKKKNFK